MENSTFIGESWRSHKGILLVSRKPTFLVEKINTLYWESPKGTFR
jgi:hypothetical protein